jgi:hypothetical protein
MLQEKRLITGIGKQPSFFLQSSFSPSSALKVEIADRSESEDSTDSLAT